MMLQRRHRHSRGQALVETAMCITVLLFAFVGVYAYSTFASDQNTAQQATRAGGRLAVEIGSGGWQSGDPISPDAIDKKIVTSVCQVAKQAPDTTMVEVDIYKPTTADGSYTGSEFFADRWDCNLNNLGKDSYTLDLRPQQHPTEATVGVRLLYHYKAPTPLISVSLDASTYSVVKLGPVYQQG